MSRDSAEESRAKSAEKKAGNIRKHTRPGDSGAERRAQKQERRPQNIRKHAESRSKQEKSSENFWGGCVAAVVVLAGIVWIIDRVADWFRNLFQ